MTLPALNARRVVRSPERSFYAVGIAFAAVALTAAAVVNRYLAKRAERDNPPKGRFVEVDGVKLHYLDQGSGEPIVLLHGNGGMIQDFESSGLMELASRKYRAIAFDRPGFGHTQRPRETIWTPEAQADLIHGALTEIGISRATIVGHSWGASVALALALKYPELVGALVLASGYYYPSARSDVFLLSAPALPVIGDVLSYTVSPILSRLLWPHFMRKMFGPASVPDKFLAFPKEMVHRPSQIRASAAETAIMIPSAFAMRGKYGTLKMPVLILAGARDRMVDTDKQSARLHHNVKQSRFFRVINTGHMVHQTATDRVMSAIDEAVQGQTGDREKAREPHAA